MVGALIADAKMAELDRPNDAAKPEIKLKFNVLPRNHPCPPRDWMQQESIGSEIIGYERDPLYP